MSAHRREFRQGLRDLGYVEGMFKYLFVDHAVLAMCRSLAAARFRAH